MIFVGIDPGLTGGIAAIDNKGVVRALESMPVMPGLVAGRKMVDARALAATLRGITHYGNPSHIAVEQVGSMPRNGGVAMFSFGTSFGIILGVLGGMGVGYQTVLPQKWQRHHSLSADKKQTMGWAQRKWPDITLRAKDDGLADALAIADWLRAQHINPS
jgi:hypothetical protein